MAKMCSGCGEVLSDVAAMCSRCGSTDFSPVESPKKAESSSATNSAKNTTSSTGADSTTQKKSGTTASAGSNSGQSGNASPKGDTAYCMGCGTAIDPSTAFCPSCGRKDPTKPASDTSPSFDGDCLGCGAGVHKSDAFCPACGRKDPMTVTNTQDPTSGYNPGGNNTNTGTQAPPPPQNYYSNFKHISLKNYVNIFCKTEKRIINICAIIMYFLCGAGIITIQSSSGGDDMVPFLVYLLICSVIMHIKKSRIAAGLIIFFSFGCVQSFHNAPAFILTFAIGVICLVALIRAEGKRKAFTR